MHNMDRGAPAQPAQAQSTRGAKKDERLGGESNERVLVDETWVQNGLEFSKLWWYVLLRVTSGFQRL